MTGGPPDQIAGPEDGKPGYRHWSRMPSRAAADKRLSRFDLCVLVALTGFADRDGVAFPSQAKLAERCGGVRRQAVNESIGNLFRYGYIDRLKRRSGAGKFSSTYYLIIYKPPAEFESARHTKVRKARPNRLATMSHAPQAADTVERGRAIPSSPDLSNHVLRVPDTDRVRCEAESTMSPAFRTLTAQLIIPNNHQPTDDAEAWQRDDDTVRGRELIARGKMDVNSDISRLPMKSRDKAIELVNGEQRDDLFRLVGTGEMAVGEFQQTCERSVAGSKMHSGGALDALPAQPEDTEPARHAAEEVEPFRPAIAPRQLDLEHDFLNAVSVPGAARHPHIGAISGVQLPARHMAPGLTEDVQGGSILIASAS